MNKTKREGLKKVGFEKEIEAVEAGKCPFCQNNVDQKEFRDELSRKEFTISGLCQKCQDKVFK